MKSIPSGTELARPFLPAKDFEVSRNFYEALGFQKLLDGDVAISGAGSAGFILQRYYQKDWAETSMTQLKVDDLALGGTMFKPSIFRAGSASVHPSHRSCSPGACAWHTSSIHVECSGTLPSAVPKPPRTRNRDAVAP